MLGAVKEKHLNKEGRKVRCGSFHFQCSLHRPLWIFTGVSRAFVTLLQPPGNAWDPLKIIQSLSRALSGHFQALSSFFEAITA